MVKVANFVMKNGGKIKSELVRYIFMALPWALSRLREAELGPPHRAGGK